MSAYFEVQARLIEHRDGVRVRDEVRLARADTHDDGVRLAHSLVADGFTVWIYRVQRGSGTRPVYRTIDVFRPERPLSPHRRDGVRGGGRAALAPPSRQRGALSCAAPPSHRR